MSELTITREYHYAALDEVQRLKAEIERLQAENAALRARVPVDGDVIIPTVLARESHLIFGLAGFQQIRSCPARQPCVDALAAKLTEQSDGG